MIFRRSQNASSKNKSTPMTQRQTQSTPQRREPELSISKPAPTAITPPISPIAMAQARRNPNAPSPASSSFNRHEQLRKLTVGRDISLNGEIGTCDHLVVEGTVTATVKDGQILDITESGSFSGLVEIDQADIAGKFEGELTVRQKLILRPTALVTGIIRYGSLQVENGAQLEGQIAPLAVRQADTASTSGATPLMSTPATYESSSYDSNHNASLTGTASPSQQNSSYLSSVLDQPGFLKVS